MNCVVIVDIVLGPSPFLSHYIILFQMRLPFPDGKWLLGFPFPAVSIPLGNGRNERKMSSFLSLKIFPRKRMCLCIYTPLARMQASTLSATRLGNGQGGTPKGLHGQCWSRHLSVIAETLQ